MCQICNQILCILKPDGKAKHTIAIIGARRMISGDVLK